MDGAKCKPIIEEKPLEAPKKKQKKTEITAKDFLPTRQARTLFMQRDMQGNGLD